MNDVVRFRRCLSEERNVKNTIRSIETSATPTNEFSQMFLRNGIFTDPGMLFLRID